jgi:hypothetical protein
MYKTHSWNWKRNLKDSNCRYTYTNGFAVFAEGIDVSELVSFWHWREHEPFRQFVLYENNFGWMDCVGVETRGMGSLWLKVFVTWVGGGVRRRVHIS